ncbi:hypothetical protein EN828_11975 [Mesorhizobium sp. M2D.F.Ca.ET.185.01.1.1]|uniref:hypothetical protein n=1 Tax=unclassified Mesorhizobium TaxID=325217 RepID=UPI000FCC4B8D|nr:MULTISPECIES: hypothetical protein [unclassified Mesorhizobium]TGP80989.1 hypothetical protein EN870_10755 [bacterium M00.F.Ca.ET.227.01.1.1]TGP90772.1 hypothetical protein EN864_18625 [bacterium M00.F.Ca.ET.221.01.1.1]TGP97451.1 hypothetical protein EN865_12395 [bacterium M00.F.Ca.ET.222.01.1.1]TGT75982.1 hypothetical protein EN802_07085 [bacterium M00.F.Ca.ET.159.01.1.1]TGT85043.1 hypothetical protein EN800_13815 [bacterium M00.F.Ca.ET.157.01.1.1]TGU07952.1 hypothetical protein EN806_319
MNRSTLRLTVGLFVTLSVSLKVLGGGIGQSATADHPANEDIAALLRANGFAFTLSAPNTDPQWFYATKERCQLQIADVSPQGWHQSMLDWQARGRVLLYSVEGKLYEHQPVLVPMMHHYIGRALRYTGIKTRPVVARAIIIGPRCSLLPIAAADLERLS